MYEELYPQLAVAGQRAQRRWEQSAGNEDKQLMCVADAVAIAEELWPLPMEDPVLPNGVLMWIHGRLGVVV